MIWDLIAQSAVNVGLCGMTVCLCVVRVKEGDRRVTDEERMVQEEMLKLRGRIEGGIAFGSFLLWFHLARPNEC